MRYPDLCALLRGSSSARRYFYTLPAVLQQLLAEYTAEIHSYEELRRLAEKLLRYRRSVSLSEGPLCYFRLFTPHP